MASRSSIVRLTTFPRESHRTSVSYRRTLELSSISLQSFLNMREFKSFVLIKFTILTISMKTGFKGGNILKKEIS